MIPDVELVRMRDREFIIFNFAHSLHCIINFCGFLVHGICVIAFLERDIIDRFVEFLIEYKSISGEREHKFNVL